MTLAERMSIDGSRGGGGGRGGGVGGGGDGSGRCGEGGGSFGGGGGEGEGDGGVVGSAATDGDGEDGGGLAGEDDDDVSASTICWWMALHVTKQCGTVRQLSWQYARQSSSAWFIAAAVKLAGRGA